MTRGLLNKLYSTVSYPFETRTWLASDIHLGFEWVGEGEGEKTDMEEAGRYLLDDINKVIEQ
jgi:hypothetical protein